MSRFYAKIQGNRGLATRGGTPGSGLWAHISGWDIGVRVECKVDPATGKDLIYVYTTGGSNSPSRKKTLAFIKGR